MDYFRAVKMLGLETGQLRLTKSFHDIFRGLRLQQKDERVIYTCVYDRLLRTRSQAPEAVS